jgi:nucleotide-binding universal stress UspA family protein
MKILCAIDGTPCSEAAFDHLLNNQWPVGSEFKIISIIEPIISEYPVAIPYVNAMVEAEEILRKQRKGLVQEKVAILRAKYPGSTVEGTTLEGFPTESILHTAEWWHADLLILGSHGRQGFSHFFLGSVSEAVSRGARCSVEIIRAGVHGPELALHKDEAAPTKC